MASTAPPSAEPMLSIAQTADLLGVSTKSVRRRIADGTLKAVRIGPRLIRVDRASVDALGRPLVWAKQ